MLFCGLRFTKQRSNSADTRRPVLTLRNVEVGSYLFRISRPPSTAGCLLRSRSGRWDAHTQLFTNYIYIGSFFGTESVIYFGFAAGKRKTKETRESTSSITALRACEMLSVAYLKHLLKYVSYMGVKRNQVPWEDQGRAWTCAHSPRDGCKSDTEIHGGT